MRILVTGGAGFIGSHLCDALINDSHVVHAVDNFLTGSRDNVAHLLSHENFKLTRWDVCNPFPDSLKVDRIFNLACPASPVHYQVDPIATTRTSVLGALNVLELAHRNDARVLQASTSEIYGDPEVHPQSESYCGKVDTTSVRSCYDEGKRCAETLFFDYLRQYGTEIKVVRIFNTYGPRMHPNDGRVVSNFVTQALQGIPLTIYGDGQQTRSFMYVADVVQGLKAAMDSGKVLTGPWNMGNPDERSVRELAELIISKVGLGGELVSAPLPADDPCRRQPDISRADKELSWQPEVALDDGLDRTIEFFTQRLSAAASRNPALNGYRITDSTGE